MGNLPFLPPQASTVAGQVDLLFIVLIALSGFFSTIVLVLIIFFGAKYRRGRVVDRSNPPVTHLRMELLWVFGLLSLGMGTFTWAMLMYFDMMQPQPEALEIYVVGQQWMWKFQHPEGPQEINELHVPVGRPVQLIMISQDVIHSFYVPAFRLKYDVIPGRYTNMWFEATEPGEYHIFCAEFCGTNHSGMVGTVFAMDPTDYAAWLSSRGGGAGVTGGTGPGAGAPIAQAGEALFGQLGCSGCHAEESTVRAPTLVGLLGRNVPLQDGRSVIADESYIRESILFPQRHIVAGYEPIMPSYEGRISEEQLIELVAYIKTLGAEDTAPTR
jgi:cytochrome c oxidase subunit II